MMAQLVLNRFLSLLITLAAVSVLVFVAMALLPGDPAEAMLGTAASDDNLRALREALGLDRPLPVRYWHWLMALLAGDLGVSYTYKVPVAGLIAEKLAVTAPLALLATALAVIIAIPLGLAAAARRNSAVDFAIGLMSQTFIAVPAFWGGLLLIAVFALTLGLLPEGGFPGWGQGVWPALKALVLPAFALALPQAGVLTRVMRSSALDVMTEDFVRTARAKGLSRKEALWRHALPNALIPVITMLGLQFTFLVAGAVLVENVFALPGLGRLAYQSLQQRDLVVMQAAILFFSAMVIIMNFVVDIAYLFIDPRLRTTRL